jgi:ArsR family transcriptional regulator, repressor of sdpIR and other operons
MDSSIASSDSPEDPIGRILPIPVDAHAPPIDIYFGDWLTTEGDSMGIDDLFRALSDPTRREILRLLRARDMTAGELASRFPLAKSTLSGHFNVLRHAGLILPERTGTSIVYSLNLAAYEEALAGILSVLGVGKARKEKRA